jgi:hypothetical protein
LLALGGVLRPAGGTGGFGGLAFEVVEPGASP